MQFRDYFRVWNSPSIMLIDSQHHSKMYREWLQGLARASSSRTVPDSLIQLVTEQTMQAEWNATPANGKYPLIISHGGGGDALSQAIRNEYLASQGYVVVSIPLLNYSAVDFNRGNASITSMLSMAQDIGFTLDHCRSLPYVNMDKIGFAGMHLQTGLAYQAQTGKLDAIVIYEDDMSVLTTQPFYDPKNIRIPLLAIGSEELRPDFSLLDSLPYSDRFILHLSGLRHVDHYQNEKIYQRQKPSYGKNYDTLNLFIHQFFDQHLKNSPEALAFNRLRSVKTNGAHPPNTLQYQPAAEALPTEGHFLSLLRYNRIPEARTIFEKAKQTGEHRRLFTQQRFSTLLLFERFHKNTDQLYDMTRMLLDAYPSAEIGERFINSIGYAYLRDKKLQAAIDCFTLGIQHYPQSANAYDALADAFAAAGNKEKTIAMARKALALLPTSEANAETKQQIEESARKKLQQFGESYP